MMADSPPRADGVPGHRRGACAADGQWASELRERCEMKGRLVAFVGVFCIASLIVSVANAEKPDRGKPPGPTKLETELIVFMGDLVGGEEVEGCCLNRGPAPAYTMHVPEHGLGNLENGPYYPPGAYTGHLFINVFTDYAPPQT